MKRSLRSPPSAQLGSPGFRHDRSLQPRIIRGCRCVRRHLYHVGFLMIILPYRPELGLTLRGTPRKKRPSSRATYRSIAEYLETKVQFEPNTGCWLWECATDGSGYGSHFLGGRVVGAHRAAWMLFHGPITRCEHVLHKCDTPACVNPNHLTIGSHLDNMKDRARKRRFVLEGKPRAKLTATSVLEIRQSQEPSTTLAARYGVGRVQVRNIQRGLVWKDLEARQCL